MNIYEKLNQQNSLDNLVCIADITSEKKIKELEEDGYYPGFTAQRWREIISISGSSNLFRLGPVYLYKHHDDQRPIYQIERYF